MEIEFKFCIPADRRQAVEAAVRRAPVQRTRLQARYFDTANGTLAAHGAVLRLRKEGRRWVQTAKALGDGPLHRLEHNVDLGVARAGVSPRPEVQRHAGTPVGERLAQLLTDAGQPLAETYGTDIWRLTRTLRLQGAVVELALDTGTIAAHPPGGGAVRSTAVCELELELVSGRVEGLVALAHRWSRAHGLWFSTVSKAEQGERLLAGVQTVPAVKATPPRFGNGAIAPDGPAVQRAVVAACLAQMLPNASEIAAGSEDAAHVHQLRIGLRRLRTALRELAPLGPGLDPAWTAPLADVFQALGAPPIDRPADAAGTPSPGEAVRDAAFQAALIGLIGFTAQALTRDADAPTEGASPAGTLRHLRDLRDLAEFVVPLLDAYRTTAAHDPRAVGEKQQRENA